MKQGQDWVEAYSEIGEAILNKETGVPEVTHVDFWHEQVDFLPEEYPWPPGSLFIEFNIGAESTSQKVQDLNCEISFYYALDTLAESYINSPTKEIALAFGLHLRKIHKFLHGRSGVNFGELNRIAIRRVPAPQYLIVYKQVYTCIIRDESAMDELGEAVVTKVNVEKHIATQPSGEEPLYSVSL